MFCVLYWLVSLCYMYVTYSIHVWGSWCNTYMSLTTNEQEWIWVHLIYMTQVTSLQSWFEVALTWLSRKKSLKKSRGSLSKCLVYFKVFWSVESLLQHKPKKTFIPIWISIMAKKTGQDKVSFRAQIWIHDRCIVTNAGDWFRLCRDEQIWQQSSHWKRNFSWDIVWEV